MQLPAIRLARRDGIRCVVADGNPECPGRGEADVFEHIDLNNADGMTEAARKHAVDGVFTAGTDFSTTVAWVAESLGLPGIPYDVALRAKDKGLMRETLHSAGVPVPPFVVYENGMPNGNPDLVPFPAVVKPVDNMGARGVRTVHSAEEREHAVSLALGASRSGRVICEAFIPGPEYSIDAISYGGTVSICGIGDRHIAFAPYFVETGHTIPARIDAGQERVLSDAFGTAVRAIGIDPGAAKGDVFLVDRDKAPEWLAERGADKWIPVVGEIAARLSGGYMSGWTYPMARGAEPTLAAMRIALGGNPEGLVETRTRYSAERAIMSIPGIIRRFDKIPEAETVFLTRNPGDRVSLPTSNVEKCGNIITTGDDYEAACRRADAFIKSVSVKLEPGDRETESFLFGSRQNTAEGRPPGTVWNPVTVWNADNRHSGEHTSRLIREAGGRLRRVAADFRDRENGDTEAAENPHPWTDCLRQRMQSLDAATLESIIDIRKASRADCLRFLIDYLKVEVSSGTHDILCDLALLAIERGGLQGCEYLIDTVTRPEDITELCRRLGNYSHDS